MTAHFAAAALFALAAGMLVFCFKDVDIPPRYVRRGLWLLMAAAFAVRSFLAFQDYAFWFDIGCFKTWGQQAVQNGLGGLYNSGIFLDYPPGYMYVLYFFQLVQNLLGVSQNSILSTYFIKLVPMLADLAGGRLVFHIGSKRSASFGLMCCALYLFSPAAIFNSAVWGQIDSWYTLLVVLSLYLIYEERHAAASVVYALALLTKPQALLFGPVLLFYVLQSKSPRLFFKTVGTGLVSLWLLALPFSSSLSPLWLINLYGNTFNGYRYFTVNGYNLYAVLDMNWRSLDSVPGSGMINIAVIGSCLILCARLYFAQKDKIKIFACAFVLITVFFCFCTMMHERYMFPALLLAMVMYAFTGRKKFLRLFVGSTTACFINTAASMQSQYAGYYVPRRLYLTVGLLSCRICFAGIWIFRRLEKRKDPERLRNYAETGAVGALMAVSALLIFMRIGSSRAPQTFYQSRQEDEWFVIRFEQPRHVKRIYSYSGLGDRLYPRDDVGAKTGCSFDILIPDENGLWVLQNTLNHEYVFTWEKQAADFYTDCVMIRANRPGQVLGELVLTDSNGEIIRGFIEAGESLIYRNYSPYLALDESHTMPAGGDDCYYSMYFDEIYHRRTAYEQLHGYPTYENTHPPLGKILISVGIALFGMTPFGWRFAGGVRGVAMVGVMYLLAKQLLKKPFAAFACAFLLAFDFMHYTQSRIATVDTFLVLFIMLMFLFMAKFADRPPERTEKQLIYLFFSGLFMGCAIAVKWNGAYSALALAVFFFVSLTSKCKQIKQAQDTAARLRYGAKICAICVILFVAVPFGVYFASFIPVFESGGVKRTAAEFVLRQISMFSYHSTLEARHFFSSPWYSWFFDIKPVWYSVSRFDGLASSISCFVNIALRPLLPAAVIFAAVSGTVRKNTAALAVTAGYLLSILPWALVGRISFIYHYFPAVIFGILAVGYGADRLLLSRGRKGTAALCGLCLLALSAFVIYFPAISGTPVPQRWLDGLELLPTWYFN